VGAGELASRTAGSDRSAVRLPVRKAMQARRDDPRAKSLPAAIVLALFIMLVAAALLVGHAVIDPVPLTAAASRAGAPAGAIVHSTSDDSAGGSRSTAKTAALTEGRVEQCAADLPKRRAGGDGYFAVGTR
jgi:hypothetical protein